MLNEEPKLRFLRYKARRGHLFVWAMRMPEDFSFTVDLGKVDQRKAGSKRVVQYVQRLEGKAGDLLIVDTALGRRSIMSRETFAKVFHEDPEPEEQLAGSGGAEEPKMSRHTLDEILDALQFSRQRATYGAVASVLGVSARSVLTGRPKDPRHSWVVSKATGLPSEYADSMMHPDLQSRGEVLDTGSALAAWLAELT